MNEHEWICTSEYECVSVIRNWLLNSHRLMDFSGLYVVLCLDDLFFTHLSLRFPLNHLHIS